MYLEGVKPFSEIFERAASRHGGAAALEIKLGEIGDILTGLQLAKCPDSHFLAEMTKAIFKAGFVWKVIDNKWPGFEAAFHNFDIDRCAFIHEDEISALAKDGRIIKNPAKIASVPANARFIQAVRKEYGGFGKFLSQWPEDDFAGLLQYLNKHGSRLGGKTAMYFLRFAGKDGFALGPDGVAALIDAGVVESEPKTKTQLQAVQNAFNAWRKESGRSYAQISRTLGLSIDA